MSSTDPLIGKRLGDYLIEGIQGTGGMARVYRGYDEKLDRYAAVKVIEPQLIASAEEEEYRERFLREARAIARLSHPRIVGIYQFGQMDNLYYIAMDYVEGRNLRELLKGYLKQGKYMPVPDVLKTLRDIGEALDYAHKQNIIHRDVKPSNIIVNNESNAILTDFGLALNALEGTIGNTFGSVHYIAPEQAISSAQAVAASDQYSLAIIAYEMLTGRVPFDDASAMSVALKHISDPPPPPRDLNPDIPVEVEQVLIKGLDKDTAKRYGTCQEFVRALETAYAAVEERPTSPTASDSKPRTATISQPIKQATPAEQDAPTITDTASRPSKSHESTSGTNSQAKTMPGATIAHTPVPTPAPSRTGLYVLGAVIVVALLAAIVILPSLLQPPVNTSATQTANAEVVQIAINATSTAEMRLELALAGTSDARMTSTANVEATATALAAANAEKSATAQAEDNANATSTADALTNATATADALQNATGTADAFLNVTGTALAVANADSTATTIAHAESTSTALAFAAATQTRAALPTATNTQRPTDTAVPPTPTSTVTNTPTNTPTNTVVPTATSTNTPAATLTPDFVMIDENDAQILLVYDGTSLVVYNRDAAPAEYLDLEFYLFEPNEAGEIVQTARYRSFSWLPTNRPSRPLNSNQCVQIWDDDLGTESTSVQAFNFCDTRLYYQTVETPFWLSAGEGAYFEVRRGSVDILTTCPVTIVGTRRQTRCTVDTRF